MYVFVTLRWVWLPIRNFARFVRNHLTPRGYVPALLWTTKTTKKKWAPFYPRHTWTPSHQWSGSWNDALLETAVTTQCTLAFGEGPDSWLGSETSRTRVPTSPASPYSLLRKMLWCEKRRVAWLAGCIYDFKLVSARARCLLCVPLALLYIKIATDIVSALLQKICGWVQETKYDQLTIDFSIYR